MTAQARGRFITLEGGEGVGKSVQAKRLEERLAALGIAVVRTREPGGSPGAEALREVNLSGFAAEFSAAGQAFLFSAARADHLDKTICRRSRAEPGSFPTGSPIRPGPIRARREFAARIHRLSRAPDGRREPARLDLDPRSRPGSRPQAGGRAKADETCRPVRIGGPALHQTLRRAFLDIAAAEPLRCVVIDANGGEEDVAAAIWSAVESRLDPAALLTAKPVRNSHGPP